MRNYVKILVAIIIPVIIWACSESFLEFAPNNGEVTDANFFQDKDDFESFIFGAYTTLQGLNGTEPGNFVIGPGYLTQDLIEIDENPSIIGNILQPGGNEIIGMWTKLYTIITTANLVLDELSEAPEVISQQDKQLLEAETRFLRGLGYYFLGSIFGNAPLITEVYTVEQNTIECSSQSALLAQAIEDLQFAAANLPGPDGWGDENLGRTTNGAALAFLSRSYMYSKEWDLAEQAAVDLINLGYYDLEPNFRDLYCNNCPDGKETIFAVQYREVSDGNYNWAGPNNQGNLLDQWSAPRGIGTEYAPGGGWGGTLVNRKLADALEPQDLRRTELIKVPGETYQGSAMAEPLTIPEDITQPNSAFSTKWWHGPADQWLNGQNLNLIRYAEFLLNYSEILFEQGKTTEAYSFLNQVRNRAGLNDKPESGDKNQFMDDLMHELRAELVYEPNFWFHLTRTGYVTKFLSEEHGVTFEDKWLLWPIPQREIDQNPNLCQNSGY